MPILKNAKHERFAQEVAKGTALEEAYRLAGYKPDPKNAARLTKVDGVRARIDEILTRAAEKAEASIARTLEEITRLAFADVGQAVSWGPKGVVIKDSESLPPEVRAAISEVKQTKDGISIKFHSKNSALDMLGKHFGIFKEKLELSGAVDFGNMSDPKVMLDTARRTAFILEKGRLLMGKGG